MAGRPLRRARLEALRAKQSGDGGGDGATGVPVREDATGEGTRGANVRLSGIGLGFKPHPPVRSDEGGGVDGRKGGRADAKEARGSNRDGLRAGGNGQRGKRAGSKVKSVSSAGESEGSSVALLEAGYRAAFEEAIAGNPETRLRDGDAILASNDQFKKLLGQALKFAEYIMDLQVDPTDRNFARVLSIKQSVATAIMSVQARIHASGLRPQEDDGTAELLRQLKAGEPQKSSSYVAASVEDAHTPTLESLLA